MTGKGLNLGDSPDQDNQGETIFREEVLSLAKEEALKMISTGTTLQEVQFGWEREGGSFWLSNNPDQIINPMEIIVEGQSFYLGIFRK